MSKSDNSRDALEAIRKRLRDFAEQRDWAQFHSPKNLVMALVSEVGELVEDFQWLTEEESKRLTEEQKSSVSEELADIQIYLIMIGEKLGIDLLSAVDEKIIRNGAKYPADKARGTSKKYTEL